MITLTPELVSTVTFLAVALLAAIVASIMSRYEPEPLIDCDLLQEMREALLQSLQDDNPITHGCVSFSDGDQRFYWSWEIGDSEPVIEAINRFVVDPDLPEITEDVAQLLINKVYEIEEYAICANQEG